MTGIIFIAAILLAGCATTSKPPEETISSPPASNEMSSLDWLSPNAIHKPLPQPRKAIAPVVPSNPPNTIVSEPTTVAPVVTWASLENWAAERKIGKVHRISDSPVTTYAIGSANGVMVLGIGTLGATWNGIEINLGFAPEFIDGEVFLHGLDLQKNLEPLLCEPPISFPQTNRVIVIDPGHGGSNTGTHSVLDGRLEKEFTLDWAKRLKPLLETNGWTVFLTRTNDTDVSLSNRVAFAEASLVADVLQ